MTASNAHSLPNRSIAIRLNHARVGNRETRISAKSNSSRIAAKSSRAVGLP
jgi:hypothetical protein